MWDRKITLVAARLVARLRAPSELELVPEAGIPTRTSSRRDAGRGAGHETGRDDGLVSPGKDADLVIIDGDPLTKMSDIGTSRRW